MRPWPCFHSVVQNRTNIMQSHNIGKNQKTFLVLIVPQWILNLILLMERDVLSRKIMYKSIKVIRNEEIVVFTLLCFYQKCNVGWYRSDHYEQQDSWIAPGYCRVLYGEFKWTFLQLFPFFWPWWQSNGGITRQNYKLIRNW